MKVEDTEEEQMIFNFFTQDLYNTTVVATDKVACCALDHFVGCQLVIFPFNSPSSLPCPSQGINMEQKYPFTEWMWNKANSFYSFILSPSVGPARPDPSKSGTLLIELTSWHELPTKCLGSTV